MGRPRAVRTPEEQRAYEERRREQKRECARRWRAARNTDEDRAANAKRMRIARWRRSVQVVQFNEIRCGSSDSDVGPYSPMREVDEPGSAAEGSDGSSLVGPSKATVTERPQSKGCQANLLSTGKSQKTASKGCQADFLSTEKPQKTVSKGCQTTGITRSQTQKTHADEIEQESRAAFLQPEKHSGSRKRPMPQDESTSRRASGPTTSSNICAYTPKRSRLSPTDASASR
ncbi:uncharacterized protein [Dermacentor albipictus]|uniref:uncharacterized protein isoform X3 n=1 Tax=Dermacentor albipictus TaxID=60249 RepID=UPI0038FCE1DE